MEALLRIGAEDTAIMPDAGIPAAKSVDVPIADYEAEACSPQGAPKK